MQEYFIHELKMSITYKLLLKIRNMIFKHIQICTLYIPSQRVMMLSYTYLTCQYVLICFNMRYKLSRIMKLVTWCDMESWWQIHFDLHLNMLLQHNLAIQKSVPNKTDPAASFIPSSVAWISCIAVQWWFQMTDYPGLTYWLNIVGFTAILSIIQLQLISISSNRPVSFILILS